MLVIVKLQNILSLTPPFKKYRGLSPKNELYRPSGSRLSAKLVPTFTDSECRVVSTTDPHGRILDFLDRSRYCFFQIAPQL
jgi:hypothetical protein